MIFVGNCTYSGNKDGTDALLKYPRKIIVDIKNPTGLLLAEEGRIINSVKITNGNVSYFGTIVDYNVLNMIQEKDTGDLFVTFSHSVGILGHQTKAFTVITGWGTVDYSIQNFTIQLQCWAI